ncbi:MAG: phenylalanine--tRNA ligase subunit beta [Bacillota bacterium]|nr:phenylalanine--tRNA ligase subunit beta [Bacillota bacterium]
MRVPIEWLKEYVKIDGISQRELLDGMILSGSNLESASNPTDGISGVVIGKITKIERHPDADKLNVCTISVGEAEPLQIVTAATNVFEGAVIPVSTVGAVLAGGLKIKKGKLRGVDSNGMLCSFSELGFDAKVIPQEFSDGILILDEEFEKHLGKNALEVLGMTEDTIEFEITPNRPDCLSIVGMARETAATFGRELNFEEKKLSDVFDVTVSAGACPNVCAGVNVDTCTAKDEIIPVRIETDLCARYIAITANHVRVAKSPFSFGLRLMNTGVRPINNIVDITNYVLMELGQPIHAFDRSKLSGGLIVRQAKDGEEVVTLDGVSRTLTGEDVLICDSEKPVAIAGVMGLLNSAITSDTEEVVFEIATFDKTAVRATSKRLGLRSEASARFEKGISVMTPEMAAIRVAELMKELEAGSVSKCATDARGVRFEDMAKPVEFRYDAQRIHRLIGLELDITAELKKLGISAQDGIAKIPHYRLDLNMDADLAEEVARMYGYDKLPVTDFKHSEAGKIEPMQSLQLHLADALVGMGLNEIMTYSFVSPAREEQVVGERESIRLLNPLGEEYSAMRTSLLPNMLDVIGRNDRRKNEELAFFEIGRIYDPSKNEEGLPSESEMLCAALYRKEDDFYTTKGIVEVLLESVGVFRYDFEREDLISYMHPGRCARILIDEVCIGRFGELHPTLAEREDLKGLYVIEISLDWLLDTMGTDIRTYKPVSMFPAAERDVAFIVDENTTSGEIEKIIKSSAKALLEEVKLFDVYRDAKIGEGKKSMAYAMKFRADRTLGEEEVDKVFRKLIKAVEFNCGATLRDS